MIIKPIASIVDTFRLRRIVVPCIAIGKTINHDQIHDVGRREALETTRSTQRCENLEAGISGSAWCDNSDLFRSRLRVGSDGNIDEQIAAPSVSFWLTHNSQAAPNCLCV